MIDDLTNDWEAIGMDLLAPLRSHDDPPTAALEARTLSRVHAAISARDMVELGTTGLVLGFLAPVLDMFAFALGLEEQGETPHD